MKRTPEEIARDLERRQDEWVQRQLENAPALTFEAQELIKRLFGPQPAQDQRIRALPKEGVG